MRLMMLLCLSVFLVLSPLVSAQQQSQRGNFEKRGEVSAKSAAAVKDLWVDIDHLVEEQKLQAALDKTLEVLQRFEGDEAQARVWAEALLKATQMQLGLHGYETSVRFLMERRWPKDPSSRVLLHLFFGHSLMRYHQMYSWEISQRELTVSDNKVDLKAWTREQIGLAIGRSFDEAMKEAPVLAAPIPEFLKSYFSANTYPAGIRPFLRDALVYMAVEHLQNSEFWSPKEANEVYKLNWSKIVKAKGIKRFPAANASVSSLERLASWLTEHRDFHASGSRAEAALEAQYELLQALHRAATEADDKALLVRELKSVQAVAARPGPWWARGQALLADLIRASQMPGCLIEARAEALKGANAFPDSQAGQLAKTIVSEIDSPSYQISSMAVDGANKRSILVQYKNLPKLYFRAYGDSPERALAQPWRGYPQMDTRELLQILSSKDVRPIAEWSEDLPRTTDYALHRHFVTPKLSGAGAYQIFVSPHPQFDGSKGPLHRFQFTISDLVVLTANTADGGVKARVLSGSQGTEVRGALVEHWGVRWEQPGRKFSALTTGSDGVAVVPHQKASDVTHHLFVKKASQGAILTEPISFWQTSRSTAMRSSFVYTDRSIYRPQQKVLWKVIAYSGEPSQGKLRTVDKGSTVQVELLDPNGEVVSRVDARANSFGTVAGEFLLPAGRPLGVWRIQTPKFSDAQWSGGFRVEEYKRPTFEVEFREADGPLILNKKVKLSTQAQYYFGLPVTSGKVSWRVTRREVVPDWWRFWGWGRGWSRGGSEAQVVASGDGNLKADGTFDVEFVPQVDPRGAQKPGLTFDFEVSADIVDDGGETRSAQRSFRLGFVSVEASLNPKQNFFVSGAPIQIESRRTALTGEGRKGEGTYRVVALEQPRQAPLPADLPRTSSESDGANDNVGVAGVGGGGADDFAKHATPGDRQRARTETDFEWPAVTSTWNEGNEVAKGRVQHAADGVGVLNLSPIQEPGVYRVLYETKDEFGATFKIARDIWLVSNRPKLQLPLAFEVERSEVLPGEKLRLFIHSGLPDQTLTLEISGHQRKAERRLIRVGREPALIEIPVGMNDRGGLALVASGVRDHQYFRQERHVLVPWRDRMLDVSFSTFRDRLRPGQKESIRISVKDKAGRALGAGAAELLAYMYDRSLDAFAPHDAPQPLSIYPKFVGVFEPQVTLRQVRSMHLKGEFASQREPPNWSRDQLVMLESYGIGGPGGRSGGMVPFAPGDAPGGAVEESWDSDSAFDGLGASLSPSQPEAMSEKAMPEDTMSRNGAPANADKARNGMADSSAVGGGEIAGSTSAEVRSNFAESAFFYPSLVTDQDGSVSLEFTVPDSVTSWNVFAHAITTDLRSGQASKQTKSVKELMVRPYVPRFVREGDAADIKVQVNNASGSDLSGEVTFDIEDTDTGKSALTDFGLDPKDSKRSFKAAAGKAATLSFKIEAPKKIGSFAVRVTAKSTNFSDGELRPFPVLPSRSHLVQSRFVTLRNTDTQVMEFKDLAQANDPSLINEKMVVTVDAQLFYSVLQALPYLVTYPYECVEQTLNRFLSTGIISSLFDQYPAVKAMAKELSARKTPLEKFDEPDANRRMTLEETPWLVSARGDKMDQRDLVNVLDPRLVAVERDRAIKQLGKMQLPSGAFPWFQGGPPDHYMTVYLLMGFARALEFKVDVPKEMVVKAWSSVRIWLDTELEGMIANECCWETVTLLNYALSSYPDSSWTSGKFDEVYRKKLLDFSFSYWKKHSPLLKGYLALTLKRMNRSADAQLVWDSVMDSAKTSADLGTYWAPEDRAWLWYNDTIESHAFSLRTEMELRPESKLSDGLVQWLFINKKLNQWKSTRATAEVIYALVHFLERNKSLGVKESVAVRVGNQKTEFDFLPDKYTGKKNQIVIPGDKINPKTDSKITVSKSSPGFAFASAAWYFSTDRLPSEDRGDFFSVSRRYFLRENVGGQWRLKPVTEGDALRIGDQIEVQISIKTRHEAEYVHLRDPRAAGLEPENPVSGYKWDLGIFWYEETRDSGSNFFFSKLPVGEYTFKYRLRANMSGRFRIAPATIQSMYAPEFNAYSKGDLLQIR